MRMSQQRRGYTSLAAIIVSTLLVPTAFAQDAELPQPQLAATSRPLINPNLTEWSLIKLTAADVASANAGAGVKVAVLDGLADCKHPDLAGRCSTFTLSGGTYLLSNKHGTHTTGIVAGKAYGVATSATVLNYGVFDDRGWVGTSGRLAGSWRSAYNSGARIASMSFGCNSMALCFSASELSVMADSAAPMLYVKAAGNDGAVFGNEAVSITPAIASAALNRTILVGSVDATGTISSFSNRPGESCLRASSQSTCAESQKWKNHFIVATGQSIYSTMPGSSYGYMTGTSMATPVVAGVAALLQQRWPALANKPEALAQILFTTATDKGAPGVDAVYGYGLLNAAAAFQANGTVVLVSATNPATTIPVTAKSTETSAAFGLIGKNLEDVTVYDRFGRDYTMAETGGLQVESSALALRQLLGRRLLGDDLETDWASAFFAEAPQPRGFAMFGSPGEIPGNALALDRSTRMGVDMPFKGGVAQFRLTGAGDARLDFAYDPTMRPLAQFASTGLLRGALIGNALVSLPNHSRLMVYGIVTTGAMDPDLQGNPLEMRFTDRGYMPRMALSKDQFQRSQTGFGAGYWNQPDANTVIGLNLSAITQRGGYYSLTSELDDFDRPTNLYNLGAAASRRMGDWEFSLSGELTHLRMSAGVGAIGFTPANMVSAEIGLRKANVAFSGSGLHDGLALALSMPPRAVSGNLRVDYMTRTPDGLGQQAAKKLVPISRLGREPSRLEAAYRLRSEDSWSFSLSGGVNLGNSREYGKAEAMASFKLAM